MRKHYTDEQRAELVRLVLDEALSLRRAAARLDVADSTAYHWVKRATAARDRAKRRPRPSSPPAAERAAPTFVQLVRAGASRSVLHVRIGAAVLEVADGFDAELLRQVVAALAEATP